MDAGGIDVGLAYPVGWLEISGASPALAICTNPERSAIVTLFKPEAVKTPITQPASASELGRFIESVSLLMARPVVEGGQAQISSRLWLWVDLGNAASADSTASSRLQGLDLRPGVRTWVFATTVGSEEFTMTFQSLIPTSSDGDRTIPVATAAGLTFREMLERLSFDGGAPQK
jgi:hypothetical protein